MGDLLDSFRIHSLNLEPDQPRNEFDKGSGFCIQGLGFRVKGFGSRTQGFEDGMGDNYKVIVEVPAKSNKGIMLRNSQVDWEPRSCSLTLSYCVEGLESSESCDAHRPPASYARVHMSYSLNSLKGVI